MDRWRYFHISLQRHILCNPLSVAKLDRVIDVLALAPGSRVLDIGCGKGEPLARIIERYSARGVGVDRSPFTIRDARKTGERLPPGAVEWIEMDGAEYRAEPRSFDAALCLGASWIYGGYRGTLVALATFVRPGGFVLSGEPYWKRAPTDAECQVIGYAAATFGTHAENVQAGVDLGLVPLFATVSNQDEWDEYETLQWYAAESWARDHPSEPDVPDLLARAHAARDQYLTVQRDLLGWAVYLFRVDE